MIDRHRQQRAAYELVRRHRFRDAARRLHALLASDPEDAYGLQLLAYAEVELRNYDAALVAARSAVGVVPSGESLRMLSGVHYMRGEYAEAEQAARDALAVVPDDPDVHWGLARAELARNKPAAALETTRAGLAIAPHNVDLLDIMARALVQLGSYEEAAATIERARALDPLDSAPYDVLGEIALKTDRTDAARAAFREALRLNPNDRFARNGLIEAIKRRSRIYRYARKPLARALLIAILLAAPFIGPTPGGTALIATTVLTFGMANNIAKLHLALDRDGRHMLVATQRRDAFLFGTALAFALASFAGYALTASGALALTSLAGFFGMFALVDAIERSHGPRRVVEFLAVALWYGLAVLAAGILAASGRTGWDAQLATVSAGNGPAATALLVALVGLALEAMLFVGALLSLRFIDEIGRVGGRPPKPLG